MKDLIRLSQPDIVLIQDTKMEKEVFLQVSRKFWNKEGGLAISSRGASGRIGTLWDTQKFELIETKQSIHWILTKLLHNYSNTQVSLFQEMGQVGCIFGSNENQCHASTGGTSA